MTTSLVQEYQRATDGAFQQRVRSAIFQLLPDVIGEAVGASVPGYSGNVTLTQGMIDRRHGWAVDVLRQPDYWVPKIAAVLAGENAVRAVDLPNPSTGSSEISDTIIVGRVRALIFDLAGVPAGV